MRPSIAELRAVRSATARQQMLLVRAALLADGPALASWRLWSETGDPEHMHSGEVRLLSGAYRRLEELGVSGPMMDVARGAYRRTWYANQLAVARIARVIARLDAAGIPFLVLKGFALAARDYRDLGARPMEDVDLLVPPSLLPDAVEAVAPLGFLPLGEPGRMGLLANEVELKDADSNSIELHAYALVESADDSDLWERRVGFAVRDAEAFTPSPEDSLLLVAAHGQRWNAGHPVSWVLDAATVVRANAGELDWDRFVARARARELTLVATRAASMLESLEVPVPEDVGRRLRATAPRPAYLIADRAARSAPTRLSTAAVAWDRYRRFRRDAPSQHRPSGPLDWVASIWGVDDPLELSIEGLRRIGSLDRAVRDRELV